MMGAMTMVMTHTASAMPRLSGGKLFISRACDSGTMNPATAP